MSWTAFARRGAIVFSIIWGTAFAQTTTDTGFYYPTKEGAPILRVGAFFMASGCNSLDYTSGQYHLGKVVRTREGDPVFAIADGTVVDRNTDASWCPTGGCPNVGLVLRHPLINGQSFQAVYGGIVTSLRAGDRVTAGNSIGVAGDTGAEDFLYFGVRLDAAPDRAPTGALKQMACASFPQANGFIDPIAWITTQRPARDGSAPLLTIDQIAQADIQARARTDSRFIVLIEGSYGTDLSWGINTSGGYYGLRWLDYVFTNNRIVRIFHTTVVGAPTVRYTIFFDPDRNAWSEWRLVQ